ncbi:hypothetical protein CHCC5027_1543 [Bacillus paralicheniformis]|nr:hypothetical protein CHCC5027_1543 [Bacillus paralicheniformis]
MIHNRGKKKEQKNICRRLSTDIAIIKGTGGDLTSELNPEE